MPWPAKAASPWMTMGRTRSTAVRADAILAGTGAAHGNGVDGFEVAGVGDHVQGDGAAIACGEGAGGSHVVLHVAAAEDAARVDVFELGEDVGGGFAEGVDHHVEASAMAHAQDGALRAELGGAVEQLVEEGDEGGDAFQREALGAEIARLDDLLEEVGAGEEVEDRLRIGLRGRGLRGAGRSTHELRARECA